MARKQRADGTGGKSKSRVKVPELLQVGSAASTSGGSGAQHHPIYRDTRAEYVAMRRSDLREIARFGWLGEGAGAAGMFFIAGAVWMAVTIFFDHFDQPGNIGLPICSDWCVSVLAVCWSG